MNETSLRWKARLGGLKGVSLLALLAILALWLVSGERILQAIQGPASPAAVPIGDLLVDRAGTSRFVSVSGFASYDVGYEETSDGQVVASYYLLVDHQTGEALVVRAATPGLTGREPASADVTGVVHDSPTELEDVVAADVSWFTKQGIALDPSFYLAEGERPMALATALALLAGSLVLGALCLPPLFLPGIVFAPRPVEALVAAPPGRTSREGLRATGRFQQLKRLEPAIEVGKRRQRFTRSPANLLQLPDGDLLVHIHFILRTKLYGVVTVHKQESDWGIILRRVDPWQIEPGILYGWKDRRALRFLHQEMGRQPETLYLSVDDGQAQSDLVQRLRGAGFPVGMGIWP